MMKEVSSIVVGLGSAKSLLDDCLDFVAVGDSGRGCLSGEKLCEVWICQNGVKEMANWEVCDLTAC